MFPLFSLPCLEEFRRIAEKGIKVSKGVYNVGVANPSLSQGILKTLKV
jgi:hypothetical protein